MAATHKRGTKKSPYVDYVEGILQNWENLESILRDWNLWADENFPIMSQDMLMNAITFFNIQLKCIYDPTSHGHISGPSIKEWFVRFKLGEKFYDRILGNNELLEEVLINILLALKRHTPREMWGLTNPHQSLYERAVTLNERDLFVMQQYLSGKKWKIIESMDVERLHMLTVLMTAIARMPQGSPFVIGNWPVRIFDELEFDVRESAPGVRNVIVADKYKALRVMYFIKEYNEQRRQQQLQSTKQVKCTVCQNIAAKRCPNCRTPYCSKQCQSIDWEGGHATVCASLLK